MTEEPADPGEEQHDPATDPAQEQYYDCPIPLSHDRLEEAHYFLHCMIEKERYHYPEVFRYNTNAFLSALKAVDAMLVKEFERAGRSDWLKPKRAALKDDVVLSRFTEGRNIALHQRAIVEGSHIEAGLFRGYKLKLAHQFEIRRDTPSHVLITEVLQPHWIGHLLDEEHMAIGEQLGVRRTYRVRELSEDDDVVAAAWRALARMSVLVSEAHSVFGATWPGYEEQGEQSDAHDAASVNLLLEMDLDPTAIERWGW